MFHPEIRHCKKTYNKDAEKSNFTNFYPLLNLNYFFIIKILKDFFVLNLLWKYKLVKT